MGFDTIPFGQDFHIALEPTDLSLAAKSTNRAAIRDVEQMALWFFLKAGGVTENVTVTLTQHTANSGGLNSPLPIKRAFYKVATTAFTNSNAATSDRWIPSITPASSPFLSWNTTADRVASSNAFQGLIVVNPAQMNLQDGFMWIEAQFTDPGSMAQLGNALWLPVNPGYKGRSRRSPLA